MKREIATTEIDGRSFRRLALISDTHGPIDPAVAERIARFDCIVHAGDVGGFDGFEGLPPPMFAVFGNNDVAAKWARAERHHLTTLPECLRVTLPGGDLIVIHGHQFPASKTRHDKLRAHFGNARAVVYGHSHRLGVDRSGTPWVLNPGASGRSRTFGGASFIELRVAGARWSVREIRV